MSMTAIGPETVVYRFFNEVINGGNLDAVDDLLAEDLHWDGGSLGEYHGLAEYRVVLERLAGGFGGISGMHLNIQETIASGNKVVIRFINSAVHTGTYHGAAPTGRSAEWLCIGIYTVIDGKITDICIAEDMLGALKQFGSVSLEG